MKKMITALCAMCTTGLFAELLHSEGFNDMAEGASIAGRPYFAVAVDSQDASSVALYDEPSSISNTCGLAGNQYLQVATNGDTLKYNINSGGAKQDLSSAVYFDSLIQFCVSEEEPEIENDDKFAFYIKDDGTGAKIYLDVAYLTSGTAESPTFASGPIALDYASANIEEDAWHRLTIKSLALCGHTAFVVYIDGVPVKSTSVASASESLSCEGLEEGALYLAQNGYLFFQRTTSADDLTCTAGTLSYVGFKGTGGIDSLAWTTTDPLPYTITWANYDAETLATTSVSFGDIPSYTGIEPRKPTIVVNDGLWTFNGWAPAISPATSNATYTAQFYSVPVVAVITGGSYYTNLTEAVSAANGGSDSSTRVKLLRNTAEFVELAAGVTLIIDNGVIYTGTVTAAKGCKLTVNDAETEYTAELVGEDLIVKAPDGETQISISVDSSFFDGKQDVDTPAKKSAYLQTSEANGVPAWQNYVMGVNGTSTENVPVPKYEKSADADKVTISMFGTLNQPKVNTGVTVTYKLYSRSNNEDWELVRVLEEPNFELSLTDKKNTPVYYKITVEFSDGN